MASLKTEEMLRALSVKTDLPDLSEASVLSVLQAIERYG